MIASWALQKAVYTALNGVITGTVFDEAPAAGAVTPYTVVGETTLERSWDTHDSEGSEEFFTLHVWSSPKTGGKGSQQVKTIMGQIDNALHDVQLPLDSGDVVLLQREFSQVLKEQVGAEQWRHGVQRYRALITS